jgi:hypothetical protein
LEENPFASVAVAGVDEDPFAEPTAAEVHAGGAERAELEELLANTRALVAALETTLERARENERILEARLQRM